MVGKFLRDSGRRLKSKGGSVCSFGSTGGGCCTWLKDSFEFRVCEWRGGVEQHITVISIDSHISFYFPPASSTDRAVNIIEVKDFIFYGLTANDDKTLSSFPLSLRKGVSFCNFSLVVFCILSFYKRIVLFVPVILKDCTVPRIRQDSCRLMSLCSYRPANPRRIRTDSKHSLRLFDMFFLLVTRLLNSKISLVPTAIPKNIKKRQEKFLPFLGLRKLSGFVSEGSSSLCLRFHSNLKLHRSNLSF